MSLTTYIRSVLDGPSANGPLPLSGFVPPMAAPTAPMPVQTTTGHERANVETSAEAFASYQVPPAQAAFMPVPPLCHASESPSFGWASLIFAGEGGAVLSIFAVLKAGFVRWSVGGE